ncbi:MAG TPA: 16S rRNA (guanine(966)-N(2))-methyltransferase RsmD [Jiangellaceae bacterium]
MTRIVAGAARGRRLKVPGGSSTRPTSDRVREALFSAVESIFGSLNGLRVLDLFAGSGALGLEAVSRGAGYAMLVESDPNAVRAIRANVSTIGLGEVDVRPNSVRRVLATSPDKPFDLVMADPPYTMDSGEISDILSPLASGWLAPEAVVVIERPSRGEPMRWPPGLAALRDRRYGETTLWYGRPAG